MARILLVEDDPAIVQTTVLRLQHEGYEVVVSMDGQDALRRVEAGHPPVDLVLLDLKLPELDGVEVCRRLKANAATAALPVIVFTAAGSYLTHLGDLCTQLGAAAWVKKPYRSEDLMEKIRTTLANVGRA
jgi:DNA-binding response OmpR family regulator